MGSKNVWMPELWPFPFVQARSASRNTLSLSLTDASLALKAKTRIQVVSHMNGNRISCKESILKSRTGVSLILQLLRFLHKKCQPATQRQLLNFFPHSHLWQFMCRPCFEQNVEGKKRQTTRSSWGIRHAASFLPTLFSCLMQQDG